MRMIKIQFIILVLCVVQINCSAPKQSYPETTEVPIYVELLPLVKRGEENFFLINVDIGTKCIGGISYFDINDNWITEDFPAIESTSGTCEWRWKVPDVAKIGVAGFRGYIQLGKYEKNIYPATFCIEVCP